MLKTRIRIPLTKPDPIPSYQNVIPAGEGWYRYSFGKWRIQPEYLANYDGRARFLTEECLRQFSITPAA